MTHQEFLAEFPQYQEGYNPSQEVLRQMGRLSILITIGPSGVGKSTTMKKLGIPYIPSNVSRSRRPNEVDGVDYVFRDDYGRLLREIQTGQFVQFAKGPKGEFYGTKASSYPDEGPATISVMAEVLPTFRSLPFGSTTSAFITPSSWGRWMDQLGARSMAKIDFNSRMAEAKRSIGLSLEDPLMHFILNDNLDSAILQIESLLDGQIDQRREEAAKSIAGNLLDRLIMAG